MRFRHVGQVEEVTPHLFLPMMIRLRDVGLPPPFEVEHVQPEGPSARLWRKVLRDEGVREIEVRPELFAEGEAVGPPTRFDARIYLQKSAFEISSGCWLNLSQVKMFRRKQTAGLIKGFEKLKYDRNCLLRAKRSAPRQVSTPAFTFTKGMRSEAFRTFGFRKSRLQFWRQSPRLINRGAREIEARPNSCDWRKSIRTSANPYSSLMCGVKKRELPDWIYKSSKISKLFVRQGALQDSRQSFSLKL